MKTSLKETRYNFLFLDRKNNELEKTNNLFYSYKLAMIYRANILAECRINGVVKIKIKKA